MEDYAELLNGYFISTGKRICCVSYFIVSINDSFLPSKSKHFFFNTTCFNKRWNCSGTLWKSLLYMLNLDLKLLHWCLLNENGQKHRLSNQKWIKHQKRKALLWLIDRTLWLTERCNELMHRFGTKIARDSQIFYSISGSYKRNVFTTALNGSLTIKLKPKSDVHEVGTFASQEKGKLF